MEINKEKIQTELIKIIQEGKEGELVYAALIVHKLGYEEFLKLFVKAKATVAGII